ncbi:MAG: bile acid:sodium symporter family protein [Verrucomicrobiales bacterium]|nr:bile acid:sodium symporter family protein [Verrucomicrobiales bacterium]
MQRLFSQLTNAFPLWVGVCSVLALFFPEWFTWFRGPLIVWGLGIIMLGMGLTLTVDDFKGVLKLPKAGVIGVACQFGIMPLLGWGISKMLRLDEIDPMLAVGLILVACCPGGTASNVVAFLARANVALSVMMTVVSTLAAIVLTPLLTKWYAGTLVEVDAWGLCKSTIQVVLLPLTLGLLANRFLPRLSGTVKPYSPFVSVVAIVLIVASIIGAQREIILEAGWRLLAAPALLHVGGFGLGYLVARALGLAEANSRTISIEVGMQNSGLGAALAGKHFPGTVAPVPCAISAVYHCLIGSLLVGFWRWRDSNSNHIEQAEPSSYRVTD